MLQVLLVGAGSPAKALSAQLSVFLSSLPPPPPPPACSWAWASLGLLAARGLCFSLLVPWLCSSGLVAIQSRTTAGDHGSSGISVFPLLAEGTGIRLKCPQDPGSHGHLGIGERAGHGSGFELETLEKAL